MNRRIRRKNLKSLYQAMLNFIQFKNQNIKYELMYLTKNHHHDDYLQIQINHEGLTMTVFEMGFTNELIDYVFPVETAMTQTQQIITMKLVDYYTTGPSKSWNIGRHLLLKSDKLAVKQALLVSNIPN